MHSLLILLIYYWLITFSLVGYGILFNKLFLRSSENDIGYVGFYGIFILILLSYISSFFIPHSELFNSGVLLVGLIIILINRKKNIIQKNIRKILIIFSILTIFILLAKNHDDFPYYHFPYTHLLTEYSNMIGLGNFNHGFRTHSSIFYLSSLFNLPYSNFFLLHLSPVFFIGFANIVLYNKISPYFEGKEPSYILYLSLLSFVFINVFFVRLGEHGTDRSAMILIIIVIIELFYLINKKKIVDKNTFLKLLIFITLIISLKTFYILYGLLLIPLIFYFNKNKVSLIFFFKNKITYLCLIMIMSLFTVNFFNSGCLLYPVKFTCFENFSWSIPISEVEAMNNWYQQWAKAGANPNFRIENPEIYIKNFNWVSNWIDMYFFNKVSDFLLGLSFLCLIVWLTFFSKKISKRKKPKFWLLYSIIIFLTIEWFYLLPTLRYGGYHLIALLLFIPLSIYLSKYSIKPKLLKKKILFIILLTIVIFLSRNISRINKEYHHYNYDILNNAFYWDAQQNFKIYDKIKKLNQCNIKKDLSLCSDFNIGVKFLNNSYIYYREN
jgi:hypothetical protein